MTKRLTAQLKKRLAQRGALSRIAELCEVSTHTVRHWSEGVWIPGPHQIPRLQSVVSGEVDLSARKTGPSKPRAKRRGESFANIAKIA